MSHLKKTVAVLFYRTYTKDTFETVVKKVSNKPYFSNCNILTNRYLVLLQFRYIKIKKDGNNYFR